MPNQVFQIYADGKPAGITVASDRNQALAAAINALTRRTSSKMGESCDYTQIAVNAMHSESQTAVSQPLVHLQRSRPQMANIAWSTMPSQWAGSDRRRKKVNSTPHTSTEDAAKQLLSIATTTQNLPSTGRPAQH